MKPPRRRYKALERVQWASVIALIEQWERKRK